MKKITLTATLAFAFLLSYSDIIYVDANSTANNPDGTSWAQAFTDIPTNITSIYIGDQIWIANGVYNDRLLIHADGVEIYGGFSGNETSLNQRNPDIYLTVIANLSSYSPAVELNNTHDPILDGIIWQNLNYTGGACDRSFCSVNYAFESTATFRNCKFFDFTDETRIFNACASGVDGEINEYSLHFENCEFNNITSNRFATPSFQDLTFEMCSFERLESTSFSQSYFDEGTFNSCEFFDCDIPWLMQDARLFGCLVHGCDFGQSDDGTNKGITATDVVNCTFTNVDNTGSFIDNCSVLNSIFWNCNVDAGVSVRNNCTVVHCILEDEHTDAGFGNIMLDPGFIDGPGGDFRLTLCSPGINMSFGIETYSQDLDGQSRTYDGIMDLGAFELQEEAIDIIYVDLTATGANNGKTWGNAFTDLNDALEQACAYTEIWVAQGTYYPDPTPLFPNRDLSFQVNAGVEVYGGFTGVETSISQRDFENNVTTLSGAIGLFGTGDNSYRVVEMNGGPDPGTRVDGFAIGLGNANGGTFEDQRGAGVKAILVNGTIANCYFTLNTAVDGAALYIVGNGGLTVESCYFINNDAVQYGGAIFSQPLATLRPDAWIDRCEFRDNEAGFGAGIYAVSSDLDVSNSLFYQNISGGKGDAIYTDEESSTNCRNLTAVDNPTSAFYTEGSMHMQNSILWDNVTHTSGSGDNNLSYCTVEGGHSGIGIEEDDPQFNDPSNGDYHLPGTSPAVDIGVAPGVLGANDLDGNARVQNSVVDHGCYEFEVLCPLPNDFCEDAIFLADPFSSNTQAALQCSSTSYETLSGCASDERSVWFSFIMGQKSAQVVIYPDGAADVNMAFFTGSCGNLTEVICVDNNGAGNGEGYAIQTTEIAFGTTVFMRVGSSAASAGTVTLEFTELECVLGPVVAGNAGNCGAGDLYQQELIVTHSHPPGTGWLVVNEQYFPIEPSPQSVVLLDQDANGLEYGVFAYFTEGSCSWSGESVWTSICCLSNDECELAEPVSMGQVHYDDNLCATQGSDYQSPCTGTGGRSVWYSFEAPATGAVEINVVLIQAFTNNFNIRQALFQGGCTVNDYVGCSNTGLPNEDELAVYENLTPGLTYLLRVDGTNAQRAAFAIILTEVEGSSCLGDFDGDGNIATSDLLILLGEMGCTNACLADMDNDDTVSTTDLLAFLAVFGTSC